MNHEPHIDDDMDDDERDLAALYASLPAAAPDARLDASVLAKARIVRRRRWPVALASAATVMLALGLGWQWQASMPDLAPQPSVAPASAAPPPPPVGAAIEPAAPAGAVVATEKAQPGSGPVPPLPALAKRYDTPTADTLAKPRARAALRYAPSPAIAPMAAPAPEAALEPAPPSPPAPPAPPAPPTDMSRGSSMSDAQGEALPPMTGPAERVARIRLLERRGRHDAARAEFKALREAFPGFVVPADLGPLAR